MHGLATVLVILLACFAPASLAQAQIGPNVPEPLTEPPPPPPPAPTEFDDEGLSTLQKLLIFGGAALVLGTIATVIVRDARKAAPPDDRPRGSRSGAGAKAGAANAAAKSTAERKRQQRAKRAKAKHARQQRKRNRPH